MRQQKKKQMEPVWCFETSIALLCVDYHKIVCKSEDLSPAKGSLVQHLKSSARQVVLFTLNSLSVRKNYFQM